eukprot:364637-Chlamydomonas_euryale.AAC.15
MHKSGIHDEIHVQNWRDGWMDGWMDGVWVARKGTVDSVPGLGGGARCGNFVLRQHFEIYCVQRKLSSRAFVPCNPPGCATTT